jgi:hypothetical protein
MRSLQTQTGVMSRAEKTNSWPGDSHKGKTDTNEEKTRHETDAIMAMGFSGAAAGDGQGRRYWLGLTEGIGEMKNPWLYRKFILTKDVRKR